MSEATRAVLKAELERMRSVAGVLGSVIAYDREALEGRLYELGVNWPDSGVYRREISVDDLDVLSGLNPGLRIVAVFKDGELVSFEEIK